jgi:ribosome-binding factor A
MASYRLSQVNHLLKDEVSKIILKEVEFPKDVLVTITRAEVSPNLGQAKIYVSVLPENFAQKVLKILERKIFPIQKKLNQRLNMKIVPQIIFVEEKETVKAGRVEELLEQIKKERLKKEKK